MNRELPNDFDPGVYFQLNPDVAAAGVDAANHFMHHGRYEGRLYKAPPGPGEMLPHDFNAAEYLKANPDIFVEEKGAADHYLRVGRLQGLAYKSHNTPMERILATENEVALLANIIREIINDELLGLGRDGVHIDKLQNLAASIDSAQYSTKYMTGVPRFEDQYQLLSYALEHSAAEGLNLEFGVFHGASINHLARLARQRQFIGFDSFEGLPEKWRPGFEKGFFALDKLPWVESNVQLVKGWFDRTLPQFLDKNPDRTVSFLHVDSDIYSSAKTIFHHLHDKIIPGTVIVFDEYFNYDHWREHEWLAFKEFVQYYRRAYKYIGVVPHQCQVAVQITI